MKQDTCHQDIIAIHHWLCSECGHGEPWCYGSHEDYIAGKRFDKCPGCGRTVDWNYWDRHLRPGETWESKLADSIAKEVLSEKPVVIEDDGLPSAESLDDIEIFQDAQRLIADGIEPGEVKRRLRSKYLGGDGQDGE